jgi:hypothetical protein
MKNFLCIMIFLGLVWCVPAAFPYTVFLKNGKSVEGKLIEETSDLIILQDVSGIKLNFKKSNLDLEKTNEVNQEVKPAITTQKEIKATTPATKSPEAKTAPQKPVHAISEEDLEKLREKYDLGEGLKVENSIQAPEGSTETSENDAEKSEDDWKKESQDLENKVRMAERSYNQLKQQCEELKGITVQTHILTDEKGQTLDIPETTRQVCEDADGAREDAEQARADRQAFEESARQAGTPPGWIKPEEDQP